MTAIEFERTFAKKYGCSVEELRGLGFVVVLCDCGSDECAGWRPMHPQADLAESLHLLVHSFARASDVLGRTCASIAMKFCPQEFTEGMDIAVREFITKRMGGVQ